jgi:chemotaxis protein histidine kinase CheA
VPTAVVGKPTDEPITSPSQGGSVPKSKNQNSDHGASRTTEEQTMRVPARILHELLEWTGNMVMARNQLLNEYDFRNSNAFRTLSQAITGCSRNRD